MSKVIWNGIVVAESDKTIQTSKGKSTSCILLCTVIISPSKVKNIQFALVKGKANYYHVEVNGNAQPTERIISPNPNPKVKVIQNYIGFGDDFKIAD
ncbi:MAG: DUF427 domain-containing protein [Bacteroidia bacterium]